MPILGSNSSGGSRPSAPVIGSATDGGTGTTASVAFTPSTYIGKGTITYTATSSPSGLTATGSSPITVTGLTTGTAYTFTVQGTTNYGVTSPASSASNSVTPANPSSFESIASATGSGVDTVTFSSIPSGYKMLQLRLFLNTTSGSDSGCFMTFNGGTNSEISYARIGARGTTAATNGSTQASGNGVYIRTFGTATIGSPAIIDIYDYTNTNKNKTFDVRNGFVAASGTDADSSYISAVFGSNSAITSITLTAQSYVFRSTNSFALYGIK